MLDNIFSFIGKILLIILFLASSVLTIYGVIFLGSLLIKFLMGIF